ncbi:MAG: TIGR03862 family flavoprotein [Burkholderiales bacterium]|nr:TIGR03862 family flavoprotein [Burkholderiales bacterium]
MSTASPTHATLAVIGGGPAGLMAAEAAAAAGILVDLYEQKASVGRKFLLAGKGGLNLTHGEPRPDFDRRYGASGEWVTGWLDGFDAGAVREWARGLGVETFVGSSGRVFPGDLKAAPLLRAWVRRLRESGVRFHVQHRWLGWDDDGALRFDSPHGAIAVRAAATVLALGGGSWPQLGSDGAWQELLGGRGVALAPLAPSNCGFDVAWSPHFATRHAGAPLKPVIAHWRDAAGAGHALQGECVVTATGIEGSLVYALSAELRDAIARHGTTTLHLDLAPGRSLERLQHELASARGTRSISEHLRRKAGIDGVKSALLHEALGHPLPADPERLARTLKRLPLRLLRARPLAEAISSAGGVRVEALDAGLMLKPKAHLGPGIYCAGEMLDWEAPTGGYLLTACLASGRRAGSAAAAWLKARAPAAQPA